MKNKHKRSNTQVMEAAVKSLKGLFVLLLLLSLSYVYIQDIGTPLSSSGNEPPKSETTENRAPALKPETTESRAPELKPVTPSPAAEKKSRAEVPDVQQYDIFSTDAQTSSSSFSDAFCETTFDINQPVLQKVIPQLSRVDKLQTDDLPVMHKRRTVRVLTTCSMTNYFISGGRVRGFEYSLIKDYENFLNRRHKSRKNMKTVMEFIPVPENQLIPCLLNGLGDIVAAGQLVTTDKSRQIDYTVPYIEDVQWVFVSQSRADPVKKIEHLNGRKIYLKPEPTVYEFLGRINQQLAKRNLKPLQIIKADPLLRSEDILEMVNAGIIDLTIVPNHLAEAWSGVMKNLRINDGILPSEKYAVAWMVRKNNPRLKASLNQFIIRHKKGTLHGNIYFNRYFKDTTWLRNPLKPDERELFSRYAPLFKKYGRKYGFDWMLLAAIAYQESGLKQNKRSRAGAVGLMQVLPSTARDKRIRIRNINTPENNVHAGTKYLALLRDSYFTSEKINPADRMRFSLAAYNAGPAKIYRCRKLAARMGYDPDQWFNHCELGALMLIGQETVRYVSNVKKYYLAYSLSTTLDCLKLKHINKQPAAPRKKQG